MGVYNETSSSRIIYISSASIKNLSLEKNFSLSYTHYSLQQREFREVDPERLLLSAANISTLASFGMHIVARYKVGAVFAAGALKTAAPAPISSDLFFSELRG